MYLQQEPGGKTTSMGTPVPKTVAAKLAAASKIKNQINAFLNLKTLKLPGGGKTEVRLTLCFGVQKFVLTLYVWLCLDGNCYQRHAL